MSEMPKESNECFTVKPWVCPSCKRSNLEYISSCQYCFYIKESQTPPSNLKNDTRCEEVSTCVPEREENLNRNMSQENRDTFSDEKPKLVEFMTDQMIACEKGFYVEGKVFGYTKESTEALVQWYERNRKRVRLLQMH